MANGEIIVEHEAMVQMHLAELDQQIATARAYPRSNVGRITAEIEAMAGESEDTAQECIYALKRDGKEIIGPTVRFAEIVATTWGNSEYGSRIIDEGREFVTAQASFRDLEKNIRIVVEVKRRIVGATGNRYGIDMIGVTSNAAMSIALRNAVLKGVPRAVWGPAYAKCLALIKGTFESIEKRRTSALGAFKKMGVDQDLVLALLEKEKVGDIEPEDMVVLRGTLQAIKDGDTTVNAVFGNVAKGKGEKADVGGHLDKGRAGNGPKTTEAESGSKARSGAGKGDAGGQGGSDAGGDDGGNGGNRDQRSAAAGDQAGAGEGAADRGNGAAADSSGRGEGDRGADDAGEDEAGRRGAGDEGGPGGGAKADATGASEDAAPLSVIADDFLPLLKGFEGPELTKLTNYARALSAATTSVQVTGVLAEFGPVFESASEAVTASFNKMGALANKAARKGKSRL